jgi:hypothetical protein
MVEWRQVYRGDFDSGSAVDVNIKGMAAETLAFPLRYGYSLVSTPTHADVPRWPTVISS